jgi:hypothetical protein
MRQSSLVLVALVAIVAVLSGSVVTASAVATIYVVHGIPDAVVDVALDGECVLEGAMFADQAGPMDIPAGIHEVTVTAADPMNPCGGEVLLDVPFQLMDGENVTAVAFLDAMCMPTAAKFENHLEPTDPGKARIVLHHTVCAPPIDISISRDMDAPFDPIIQGMANGDQVLDQVRPGEWYVSIAEAGSGMPAVGPTLVRVKPFMTYRVYAIGSLLDGSATVVAFEDRTR